MGNPAALAAISQSRIGLSHLSWGESLAREWLATGLRIGGGRVVACDFAVLHSSALTGYDLEGRETGSFHASEWNAGLTGAWTGGGAISVGLGARYFRLEDPSAPLGCLAGSVGLSLRRDAFVLGLAANDIGTEVASEHGSWKPPTSWIAGLEFSDQERRWALGAAVIARPSVAPRPSLGAVLRPTSGMEILGGYALSTKGTQPSEGGWSSGLSLTRLGLTAAYAVQSSTSLGLTHQIGLSAALSSGR